MAIQTRFRVAAAVGALIAPMALVATASAPADAGTSKHKHEVYMYKVEKNIRLSGVGSDSSADSGSQILQCDSGDSVLDGMWSVKHVDQYQPPQPDPDEDPDFPSAPTLHGVYDDERDVWVQASYPVHFEGPSDFRSWQFNLENKAWGDAQVKLFLTCIRGYTEYTNSHRHQVVVRDLFGGAYQMDDQGGWYGSEPQIQPWGSCRSDEYFVAPGFDVHSTNWRLRGTYPRQSGRSWGWSFISDGTPFPASVNIDVYGRCISRRVVDGPTPKHSLGMVGLPSWDYASWYQSDIVLGDPVEKQYTCDQQNGALHAYKAMVAWFWLDTHWDQNWYLGMEPRPKTRAFTFWNHAGSNAKVRYGTLCVNSRTSFPLP
ncbi:hypothetical protein [Nocardioides sp. HB32]|jgi:hypothetical protein